MTIKKYILEELEELGEVALILLIPKYLEFKHNKPIKYPVGGYMENYNIMKNDFLNLSEEIYSLCLSQNIGLFQYDENFKITNIWEDKFILLNDEDAKNIFENKENWTYKEKRPSYFLAKK